MTTRTPRGEDLARTTDAAVALGAWIAERPRDWIEVLAPPPSPAAQASPSSAGSPCEAAGAAIDADWSPTVRADLARAFAATGEVNADTILERTTPWLDRWALAWRRAQTQVCVAAEVVGILDPGLQVRAQDCLDERRGSFTGEFAEARGLFERELAAREQIVGTDHPAVALSLETLGSVDTSMGAFDGARARIERSRSIRERALGPTHPLIATIPALNNLATIRVRMGDLAGARALPWTPMQPPAPGVRSNGPSP